MAARWRTWDIDFISAVSFDTDSDVTEIQPVGTERGFAHFKLTSIVLPKEALGGSQSLQNEIRGRGRTLKSRALSSECPGRRPGVKEKVNTVSPLATAFFGPEYSYDETFPDIGKARATAVPQHNTEGNKQQSTPSFADIIRTSKQSSQPTSKPETVPSNQSTNRLPKTQRSDNHHWRRTPSPKHWDPINQRKTVHNSTKFNDFNKISRKSPTIPTLEHSRSTTVSPKPIKPFPLKPNMNKDCQKSKTESIFSTIRSHIQNNHTISTISPIDDSTKSGTQSIRDSRSIENQAKAIGSQEDWFEGIKDNISVKKEICSESNTRSIENQAKAIGSQESSFKPIKEDVFENCVKSNENKDRDEIFMEDKGNNKDREVSIGEVELQNKEKSVAVNDMSGSLLEVEECTEEIANRYIEAPINEEACRHKEEELVAVTDMTKTLEVDKYRDIEENEGIKDKMSMKGGKCSQTQEDEKSVPEVRESLEIDEIFVEEIPEDVTGRQKQCDSGTNILALSSSMTVSPNDDQILQCSGNANLEQPTIGSVGHISAISTRKSDKNHGLDSSEDTYQIQADTLTSDCVNAIPEQGKSTWFPENTNQTFQGDLVETSANNATIPLDQAPRIPANPNQIHQLDTNQIEVEETLVCNPTRQIMSCDNQTSEMLNQIQCDDQTTKMETSSDDDSTSDNEQSLPCSENERQTGQAGSSEEDICESFPEYEESSSEQTIQHLNHLWSSIQHDFESCKNGSIALNNIVCVQQDIMDDGHVNRSDKTEDELPSTTLCGDNGLEIPKGTIFPDEHLHQLDFTKQPNIVPSMREIKNTNLEYEVSVLENEKHVESKTPEKQIPEQSGETSPLNIKRLATQGLEMDQEMTVGYLLEDTPEMLSDGGLNDVSLQPALDTHPQDTEDNNGSLRCTDVTEELKSQTMSLTNTMADTTMDRSGADSGITNSKTSIEATRVHSQELDNDNQQKEVISKLHNQTPPQQQTDQLNQPTDFLVEEQECGNEPCHVKLENLPPSITLEDMMEIIEPYGEALSYVFIEQPESKACIVRMVDAMCGEWLVVSLDGLVKDGYRMRTSLMGDDGN